MTKFQRFIQRYGQSALARELGISRSAVHLWRHGRARPAVYRAMQIASRYKGRITLHDIRPDVWGPEKRSKRPERRDVEERDLETRDDLA